MQYRKDPRTGEDLSVLGFGCMRFPRIVGNIDMKKTEEMVMTAVNAGVNYFDTAWIYPGSEEALGTILAKNSIRDRVLIASKMPVVVTHTSSDLDRYFEQTLKRLKTDHVDYYLMHMLTDMGSWEKMRALGVEDWLAAKKKKGAIRSAGFSFHGIQANFLKILNAYDWDFCQIQYNYSDENYQAGKVGLAAAAAKNLAVIIMEPLLGGKLVTHLPRAAVEAFASARPGSTPAEWGLAWLWDQKDVTVILSGMSTASQLDENLRLAESARVNCVGSDERAVYAAAVSAFRAAFKVPCTGCNYCMPCPKNVNIPGCFAAYNASYAVNFMEGLKQYFTANGATSKNTHLAGHCVQCGKCESHCPQKIAISTELERVRSRLEPWWVKIALALVRAGIRPS